MEMSWDRLADRCQLFTDTNKGMLIELLKEAEEELARKVNIFEQSWNYSIPFDSRGDTIQLPDGATRVRSIRYNGNLLTPLDDSEFVYNSNNSIDDGTPSSYFVKKGYGGVLVYFDRTPTSGKLLVDYYASRPNNLDKQVINHNMTIANAFWLNNGLGSALTGLKGNWRDADNPNSNYFTTLAYVGYTATSSAGGAGYHKYTFVDTGTSDTPTLNAIVQLYNYGSIAPMIPFQYHKDLCDYAISIALAKENPQLSDKHLMLWERKLESIKTEDIDKDLIHTMRREI